jgi:hypothetical protein
MLGIRTLLTSSRCGCCSCPETRRPKHSPLPEVRSSEEQRSETPKRRTRAGAPPAPRRGSTSSRRKGRPGALLPSGTGSRDWLALGNACARRVQVLLPALPNVGGGPLQRRRSYYLSAGSPRQFGAYRCACSKFRGCTRMARCATRQRPPVTLRRLCRSNDDPERASAAWRVCVHPIARSKSAAGRQHRHHSDGDRALSLAEVSCPPPPSPPRKDADPSLLRGHSM